MKVYLMYYKWPNTAGNHAGMEYLAKKLKANKPYISLIQHIPQQFTGGKYIGTIYSFFIMVYLTIALKKGDKVFFMEYLGGGFSHQERIAKALEYLRKDVEYLGLVHLAGTHLLELYKDDAILSKKLSPINKVVVFGSTLKKFIISLGYKRDVIKSYHYVDTDYYKPSLVKCSKQHLQVIVMGSLKRNFVRLKEIIRLSDIDVNFNVCVGNTANYVGLEDANNVTIYKYLQEGELLKLMQNCDVNLSVLEDTIGSNAITTAFAVGLVQVVSDVGSIRDYCNEKNSIICSSTEEFVAALKKLSNDRDLLTQMKDSCLQTASLLALSNYYNEFESYLNLNHGY
jgi:glycosyltransferase involved in cell wall biosynthesis